jgi:hypothetical protein
MRARAVIEQVREEAHTQVQARLGQMDHQLRSAGPHVVAILPRGEAIRNFVYSGALDEVARQADLRVLSVNPGEETWALLKERYENVLLLEELKESRIVGSLRDGLDLAHGRWLWSEAARERWRLRDVEADSPVKQLKRLAKKLSCYPFANRTGLELLSRAERASSRMFSRTNEYVRFFREHNPSLVFNCSHVHSRVAIQAVQAAQWLEIPTATFIFSWDNLTSQGRIMPPYDYYLVWNEAIRDQLLEIYQGIRAEQVFVTGTPQFDFHFKPEFYQTREEFCARVMADPSRPIVLYSTGMPNHMPGEPEIVEGIADLLREMDNAPQLLVRVYPKDLTNRFDELRSRRADILFPVVPWERTWLTPRYEDSYLLTNTLRHAAVGINVASTVSLELCMFDKPVINVGYNPKSVEKSVVDYARYYKFDHYRPVVESGAINVAHSEDEMKVMLREALADPRRGSIARHRLIALIFGQTLDGGAGLRVADCLVELAAKCDKQDA